MQNCLHIYASVTLNTTDELTTGYESLSNAHVYTRLLNTALFKPMLQSAVKKNTWKGKKKRKE